MTLISGISRKNIHIAGQERKVMETENGRKVTVV
jgi:hypothetical protein